MQSIQQELINNTTIQLVKSELSTSYDKEFLDGNIFRNQVICYSNEHGWSVNEIVDMYLKMKGLK